MNQNYDVIKEVMEWNQERNLDTQGFDVERESAFIMEELLEVFCFGDAKECGREFAASIIEVYRKYEKGDSDDHELMATFRGLMTPDSIADAFGDIIVFAIGSLTKICNDNPQLGSPYDIMRNITEANKQKGKKTDAKGKIIKDKSTFKEPVHEKQ
jgi:hypothetical protein